MSREIRHLYFSFIQRWANLVLHLCRKTVLESLWFLISLMAHMCYRHHLETSLVLITVFNQNTRERIFLATSSMISVSHVPGITRDHRLKHFRRLTHIKKYGEKHLHLIFTKLLKTLLDGNDCKNVSIHEEFMAIVGSFLELSWSSHSIDGFGRRIALSIVCLKNPPLITNIIEVPMFDKLPINQVVFVAMPLDHSYTTNVTKILSPLFCRES